MLKAVLENKAVKALVFLSILITSILEVMEDFDDIGAHHGLFFFSLFSLLKVVAEFYEAGDVLNN